MKYEYLRLRGDETRQYINIVAAMRIEFFSSFPYLYQGTLEQEQHHIEKYCRSKNAQLVVALNGSDIAGFCTAIPLGDESSEIKDAFPNSASKVFYIGEVIIKEEHRGQGILRKLFDIQEEYAKEMGFTKTAFLTVVREPFHPARPKGYHDLDPIWQHMGYFKNIENTVELSWPSVDQKGESLCNTLVMWVKDLTH